MSVGLPKITSKSKRLASIDDDYEEQFEDRMPSKPHGVSSMESGDDSRSAKIIDHNSRSRSREQLEIAKTNSVGVVEHRSRHRQQVGSRKSNMLPQVSNRSRQSFEEVSPGDNAAYSNAEGRDSRNAKGHGLNSSPSVISLHDQSKASINAVKAKRSNINRAGGQNSSDND